MYQEGKRSGIVWALKEVRAGSIYSEFIAYLVQVVEDDSYKTLVESGVYDAGKWLLSEGG
ncbi:hypothetical protein Q4591_18775 [Shewanella sp. 3_MG-2023]|uniref:hypothetical protein n=1 Tax=Shewanella sp. 3_MG-2023 TaxID=3062635 RepID=UPI0026E1ABE8|nr:hypothetical protein [Shewanella sp. 3_MG-2023]MDO6777388.1 hypothetical protein [Shewanella sp. 3_MG-2023]